jgi:hypothetical protein
VRGISRLSYCHAYPEFLEAQVARYREVSLVLRNHEFYGMDYSSGLEAAQRLSKKQTLADGLELLHRTRGDDPEPA